MTNPLEMLANIHRDATPSRARKVPVYIRLDPEVVAFFKSKGPGYQARINDLLVDYVKLVRSTEATAESPAAKEANNASMTREQLRLAQGLFRKYYTQCFWHLRRDLQITAAHIPLLVEGLRRHGGRAGFLEAMKLCQ